MDRVEGGPARPPGSENRARDHLANERTFLAWIRTALGLIGLGFVLARMGLFLEQLATAGMAGPARSVHGSREFLVTGVIFLALGTGLSAVAGWLYHRAGLAIDGGRYEPARGAVYALTAVVAGGGLTIAGLVVWQLALR